MKVKALDIKLLDNSQLVKDFCSLQELLYKEKSRPINSMQYWMHLLNVFKDKKRAKIFVAYKNDLVVGRILASISHHGDKGYWGMLEYDTTEPGIVKELLENAEEFLISNKCEKIFGPIDFSTWFSNRFIENEDSLCFSWEPNNPKEYISQCLACGYEVDKQYITNVYKDGVNIYNRTQKGYDKAITNNYKFRGLSIENENEVRNIFELNLKGFKNNYLYEPISYNEFKLTYLNALRNKDLTYSFVISNTEDIDLGFIYAFLDQDYLIIKSLLVDPLYQGAQLSSALLHKALKEARADGYNAMAGALVRKGNISEYFFENAGKPYSTHHYSLLRKLINK